MKIVFVSNYFNHHQKALSDELFRLTDGNYTFISTTLMREERRQLGYTTLDVGYELRAYESEEAKEEALRLISEADVVIAGSADYSYIKDRIKSRRLLFKYGERPFKNGPEFPKFFGRYVKWNMQYPRTAPVYLLCASAYAAWDYSRMGMFLNKTYRWAYFTDTRRYDDIAELMANKRKNSLLWVARFLDWKHPEQAVDVAARLKNDGFCFELAFIGIGPEKEKIVNAVEANGLHDCVRFLDAMSPDEVRNHMEQSEIFLITSDKREGWGAVVNEAMNSGCAVIGSHEAGSVPFLINDGINGMIFQTGNTDMLYEKTRYLLEHPEERAKLGKKACETITDLWNADVAAQRFTELAQRILSGEKSPDLYPEGPCSKASVITDRWKN